MKEDQLKIGITCYPTYGGSGVIATEIGMAMARKGHKVHFICYDVPRRLDRFTENVFFHEVEMRDYPLFSGPQYLLGLASKIVEVHSYEKLDLLHMHYAVPHATSAYLAKQVLGETAPKIITTLHGTDITLVGNDRSYLPITRFSIVQSDGVTTPSHYLKNATYDKLNVSTDFPIEVIPNFVDVEKYKPRAPGAKRDFGQLMAGCSLNDKIITHVSNFRPVKRIQDVVKVFAEVRKQVTSHLVLVGDGPERSRIEDLVRELKLEQDVCFLGKQESFVEILQASDVFLLPSESESFGLAALEAMSCGVPVVASNAGGIPEVVIKNETGFLSDIGDIEGMSRQTVKLLTDDTLHKSMSDKSRARAMEEFDEDFVTKRYEDYYFQIMG